MKLKTIKASNAKGYLVLGFDTDAGYERYTVSEVQYSCLGSPLIGDALVDGDAEKLLNFSEYNKAKKKALNILAFGDNSRFALSIKLARAGFSVSVAREITEEMCSLGYIDEERQLRRIIASEVNGAKIGIRKLLPKLRARGYSAAKTSRIFKELCDSGEIDPDAVKLSLTEGVTDIEEKRKILYKHGF